MSDSIKELVEIPQAFIKEGTHVSRFPGAVGSGNQFHDALVCAIRARAASSHRLRSFLFLAFPRPRRHSVFVTTDLACSWYR